MSEESCVKTVIIPDNYPTPCAAYQEGHRCIHVRPGTYDDREKMMDYRGLTIVGLDENRLAVWLVGKSQFTTPLSMKNITLRTTFRADRHPEKAVFVPGEYRTPVAAYRAGHRYMHVAPGTYDDSAWKALSMQGVHIFGTDPNPKNFPLWIFGGDFEGPLSWGDISMCKTPPSNWIKRAAGRFARFFRRS